MSGHTKEPWVVYADDTAQVDGFPCIDGGDGQLIVGTEGFYTEKERDFANARRIVDCVNALTGIENPAAFVEAARGMAEALGTIEKTMDGYRSQAKFCDVEALGYFREFDRRVEKANFRNALTAFRAQIGEA